MSGVTQQLTEMLGPLNLNGDFQPSSNLVAEGKSTNKLHTQRAGSLDQVKQGGPVGAVKTINTGGRKSNCVVAKTKHGSHMDT